MTDDSETLWQSSWINATHDFAAKCAVFRDSNPFEQPALEEIIAFLATELFDRRFSVSEIGTAFNEALAHLPRYAAGEERRGDKY